MSLTEHLLNRIDADGPISIADYMTEALLHPRFGYYTTRDPLGRAGDFTTAPEISQMFGELIGLCLVQCWMDQGAPEVCTLCELGPGRGTLIRDALRAAKAVPAFQPKVVLMDASPALRAIQAETLSSASPEWVEHLEDLPGAPVFLIANEFFDALPIRQFQRSGPGWREVRVGAKDGALHFGLGQAQAQPMLSGRLEDTRDGDIVEICPSGPVLCQQIGAHIAAYGGAALLIDYGDWHALGDTFQAMRSHTSVHPLQDPGQADLTAHVDFEALAASVAPARHTKLTPQGVFLERLGITPRAQALASQMGDAARETHIAAHRRLTHPAEMGNLFKVLGIVPESAPPPPGLEL